MSLITLAEAKEYIEISHDAQNAVIQILLDGVEEWAKNDLGLLLAADVTVQLTELLSGGHEYLNPEHKPILEVVSVTDTIGGTVYTDIHNDTTQVWRTGMAFFSYSRDRQWQVVLKAGYNAASLPAGLKMGLLDMVYRAYRNRGGKASETAAGFTMNWRAIADSDIMDKLEPYNLKSKLW